MSFAFLEDATSYIVADDVSVNSGSAVASALSRTEDLFVDV